MKIHDSKCLSEIYRLLPVIGILLLALLGLWWGNRAADEPAQSAVLQNCLYQPVLTAKRLLPDR